MIEAGWSPSVRLFEAAACRTPIISDRWAGLTNLLPETDAIVIADDTATVVGTLTSPDRARYQHMADRALTIVKSCHTGLARAGSLEREIAAVTRMTARHTFQVTSSG
jgi:spore maturation protein CgeB